MSRCNKLNINGSILRRIASENREFSETHRHNITPHSNTTKGQNNDLLLAYIDSLSTQYKMISQNMNDLEQQRALDVQTIYDTLTAQIQILTNKLLENEKQSQEQIASLKHRMNVIIHNNEGNEANSTNIDALKGWLTLQCQLPQYLALFLKYGYDDLTFVCNMNDNDLKDIGIDECNHREQINREITRLNTQNMQNKAVKEKCEEKTLSSKQEVKSNHIAIPTVSFKHLPDSLKQGCAEANINEYNALQSRVMDHLCGDGCNLMIAPAGSGKTVSIIISSIYKLYSYGSEGGSTGGATGSYLFIAVDDIHVVLIKRLCDKLVKWVPDFNVITQIKESSPHELLSVLKKGKNIVICSLSKANSVFEEGGDDLKEDLIGISIFDGDTLCMEPLFSKKTVKLLEYAPQNVDINVISNSFCISMQENIFILFGGNEYATHKYNYYNNLIFWNIHCNEIARIYRLMDICRDNPFGEGLIFCSGRHEAKIVNKNISEQYTSAILSSNKTVNDGMRIIDMFNDGSIEYIILYTYSPFCLLKNINIDRVKMIIHYQIKSGFDFLKKCCSLNSSKIHCISLVDKCQMAMYDDIQRNCNIKFKELLPSNIGVLADNNDIQVTNDMETMNGITIEAMNEIDDDVKTPNDLKSKLLFEIDEYLVSGEIGGVLALKCLDFKVWTSIISSKLRFLNESKIEYFIDLMVDLFRNNVLDNDDNRFNDVVFSRLIFLMDTDTQYIKYLAHLIAHLCLNEYLDPMNCYPFFIKRFKECSEESEQEQIRNINQFIIFSVQELVRLQASQKMIFQIKKYSINH